jgi:NADH-quinone oxidoreductase subunit I
VTIRYIFNPKRIVTKQYPENRSTLVMIERFRGGVIMPHYKTDKGTLYHHCTACGICEKACPNGSISILPTRDLSGKRVLGRFVYRLSQCAFCNFCVEACPFGAIRMGHSFENAKTEKESLTLILNQVKGRVWN